MEQPAPEEPSFPNMKSEAEEGDLRAAWAMEDDDPVATFAQHPTLYYPDGNVILSCEDEDTLFRVHRSILAKGCPALNDLITDSERRDRKPDLLAGCVHIPLSDSRKDVETLLRIVYHDFRVDALTLVASDLPLLSSIYRVATKYQLERTIAEVHGLIKLKWPSQYAAHANRRAMEMSQHRRELPQVATLLNQTVALLVPQHPPPLATAPPTRFIHPAHVIALLRQGGCNDPELLVPLFYALTCATPHEHFLSVLRPDDFVRYVRGLERIRTFHAQCAVVYPAAESLLLLGDHVYQCWPGIRFFWADLSGASLRNGEIFAAAKEPVELWASVASSLTNPAAFAGQYGTCSECVGRMAVRMSQISSTLWAQLPRMFDMQ